MIPVIALTGVALAVLFILAFSGMPFTTHWHFETVAAAALFGALFAAPVTLAALPVSYRLLSRSARLSRLRLGAIGMACAIIAVLTFIVEETVRFGLDPGFIRGMLLVAILCGLVGLVVGIVFAVIMRWCRPEDWAAAHAGC